MLVNKLLFLLGPCSYSGIFFVQCPLGSPNLLTYSNWLLLAALTHNKYCFRIKELGTIETGSGPADKSARPVKTLCRSLGARGPSASCHPILTWWLTRVGPYDHEGTFQGPRVGWAGSSTSSAPGIRPPPHSPVCADSILQLISLCLQFCIPISPLASESIL